MNRRRLPLTFAIVLFSGGCRDGTITRGADGAPEWRRRLSAAVPVGSPADSAWAVLTRNGFRCRRVGPGTGLRSVWCDKYSGGRLALVRRRWQATMVLDDRRRVAEVHASTGLVGP